MFDEVGFLLATRSAFEKHSAGSSLSALGVPSSQKHCYRAGETAILQNKNHASAFGGQPISEHLSSACVHSADV